MNKKNKIIYYAVTGLFSAHMLMTAAMYFFKYEMVEEVFVNLGFSPAIIYPLATIKILGLIAIWTNKSRILKELAYAGFAVDFILASSAHFSAGDGHAIPALVALTVMTISYIYHRKVFVKGQQSQVTV